MDQSNRFTVVIGIVVVLAAGWFFMKAFKSKPDRPGTVIEDVVEAPVDSDQDQMGQPIPRVQATPVPGSPAVAATPVQATASNPESEADRRTFAAIVDDMRECLEMGRAGAADASPTVDTLTNQLQSDFGPIASQGDRWLSWKLRTPGGEERLLRVDYFEDEMGTPQREVHYFSMRSETDVFPIDIPPDKSLNPSNSYIDSILQEGQIHYQEKAKYAIFPSGERVDFVEKNGALAEIEVTRGEHFFRCDSVKARQSCHCVKEE